jgi:cytidylate kinase
MPAVYEDELFAVESEIIRGIAAREQAVFVGRAAGWVLRGHAALVSVFLHAPESVRAQRIIDSYGLRSRDEAKELLRRSDQQRGRFLQSLCGGGWLNAGNYQMCFDTGAVALDEVVEMVVALVAKRQTLAA